MKSIIGLNNKSINIKQIGVHFLKSNESGEFILCLSNLKTSSISPLFSAE